MHDYNVYSRAYWWTVAAIGYVLLANSLYVFSALPIALLLQSALAILFVGAVAFFPVKIPGSKLSVTGGEIFIFLALLLFGVEAAVVAAALDGAIGSVRTSKRWTSWFGSPAMAAIAVSLSGYAFLVARAALERHDLLNGAAFMLLLTVFALLYSALSNLLPSILLSLKLSERLDVVALFKERNWMAVAHVCSAAIAGLLYYAGAKFGVWVLFASLPAIVLSLSSAHFLFARADAERKMQSDLLEAAHQDSQRAQAHADELERSQARFHGAFTNAAIGMALVSTNGEILQANPAVCKMLGYYETELLGGALGAFMPAKDFSLLLNDIAKVTGGVESVVERELYCIDKRGELIGVSFSVAYFGDGTNDPDLIVQMQDIRERKQAQAKLLKIAFHDPLTGLPNRVYFRDQLAKALARSKRADGARFALMFLDFDRFKAVNDSLGHGAGDELLVGFATRIKSVLRATDTVARLGGDEFAVLVEDVTNDERVMDLAQRIQDTFREPFRIEGTNITSSASIGIAFGNPKYENPDEIIRDADLAMYKAKTLGKAQYAVFDSSLHDRATAELQLENELRRAIDQGELRIHYQPQYGLSDRALCGYEALVRWAHPKRGLLYPSTFLPIAEETGLIIPLGQWMITQVCIQMKRWRQSPQGQGLRVSINVSGRELRQVSFTPSLIACVRAHDIPTHLVNLELSERALIEGFKSGSENLAQLRAAGISINIDDFGTGFSSLSHLANLPIDGIKIDRSFVQQASETVEAKEIIRAITSLGRALGKRVHAQGIETEAQWRIMQELGCDVGQGNVCSPPISADEIALLMSTSRLLRASV
jgi:diguanylate cyclase (GGDEF)-like protein/PAS domain S-box-containing protein